MATDLNRLVEMRAERNKDLLREAKQARNHKPSPELVQVSGPRALLSLALALPLMGAQLLYMMLQRGRHPF